jgi:spermidine/putrescine-binding protein
VKKFDKAKIAMASLAIAASLALTAAAYIFSQQQGIHMQKAAEHIPRLEPSIRADSRFQNVQLQPFTSDNGCLLVRGFVESNQALEDLRHIVEKSNPPVVTKFVVDVIPVLSDQP